MLEFSIARRRRGPLRPRRAAAAFGYSSYPARFIDGAPRPPRTGDERGCADRRLHRQGVRSRTAFRRRFVAGRRASGSARSTRRRGACLPPRRSPGNHLHIQARIVRDAAYESLLRKRRQDTARPHSERHRDAISQMHRGAAGAGRRPLQRGGTSREGDRILAAGRPAGSRSLGQCGSYRASQGRDSRASTNFRPAPHARDGNCRCNWHSGARSLPRRALLRARWRRPISVPRI